MATIHKPSLKWVEMVVAKEAEKGRLSKRALAQYKRDLYTKHGFSVRQKSRA